MEATQLRLALLSCAVLLLRGVVECAVGVNWGSLSAHRLPPSVVVELLAENRIRKVKLFDSDASVLRALMGRRVQVMVGVPNDLLASLGASVAASDMWVKRNISRFAVKGGVDIRYIAVGNEPFLRSYQGRYQALVLPAMMNLQQSLAKANLAGYIKLVVPCNADAYESSVPSQGSFRSDLTQIMTQLVSFLSSNGSPFVVNIYPFLSLYQNPDFPEDYAFFQGTTHPLVDGQNVYYNAFDGNYDTLVAALNAIGYGQIPIVVGEVGWPTDGAAPANLTAARAFNQGLVNHVLSSKGTPLRPGKPPMDVYLFGLFDEDQKSTLPGNFERHWGIFSFDGQAKYSLDLGFGTRSLKNAKYVSYLPSRWCVAHPSKDLSSAANHVKIACDAADCTALLHGGSCNSIGDKGNISYAFNSYYQLTRQSSRSCDFDGLGMITFLDPSIGDCRFLVGISESGASPSHGWRRVRILAFVLLWVFFFLCGSLYL